MRNLRDSAARCSAIEAERRSTNGSVRGRRLAGWLLLMAIAATRCRSSAEPPRPVVEPVALRVGLGQWATTASAGIQQVAHNLSDESVVRFADDGRTMPDLADAVTISPDGL